MFCSQCGKQIKEGSKFCTFCGTPVATNLEPNPSAPPTPPTPTRSAERVVWVFRVNHKLKLFKIVPCHVVFMEDKVVFAYLTPELQKSESAKVSQKIKDDKIGFFKGSAAMMKYWADFDKRYYNMSSNEILAEDPSNMMISNHQIVRVTFDGADTSDDDDSSADKGKLYFDIAGHDTLKFTHAQPHDRSIKDVLLQLFGNRLKYNR